MVEAKILVVEDELVVAHDIRRTLEDLKYAVLGITPSGEEAVEKAGELRPDLVLMDIKLKGAMDGVEAAEQIRTLFDIPVVYLTAYADDEMLQRSRITEPFGYVLKPFEERELHSAIQIALYRHEMERKLRNSEERFRTLIENTSDIIQVIDGDGCLRYISPSVKRVLGYEPEELIGKRPFEFLHPDDVSTAVNEFTEMVQDRVALKLGKGRFRRKDGSWCALEVIGHNMLDDPVVRGIVVNSRDVTERMRAEEALKESEKKFRTLAEQSPNMIWVCFK